MLRALLPVVERRRRDARVQRRARPIPWSWPSAVARHCVPEIPVTCEPSAAMPWRRPGGLAPRIVAAGSIFLLGDVMKEIGTSRGRLLVSAHASDHRRHCRPCSRGCCRCASAQAVSDCKVRSAAVQERDRREPVSHFIGHVEIEWATRSSTPIRSKCSPTRIAPIATGNVVFAQGNNRIAADARTSTPRTRLGTFYNASGVAFVQPPRQAAPARASSPRNSPGQENVVYFFGDTVEKLGPKKYKITNGGFSTCVQPTPRWDLHADTVVLNVDHYTLLTSGRADGQRRADVLPSPSFVLPDQEGGSGHRLPAADLRLVDDSRPVHPQRVLLGHRSQSGRDLLYDWFSKTGQGLGSEYRYNLGAGSDGNLTAYTLDQHQSTYVADNGGETTLPATRSLS